MSLLEHIDGVHFTGGGLDLYDFFTGEYHPYYITAKRIFNYATSNKALNNGTEHREFLVTGFCQGFELLGMLASNDKPDLLRYLPYDNVERPVFWNYNTTEEVKKHSRLFEKFENSLLQKMHDTSIAFHYHSWGISQMDFDSIPSLKNFFKVISTDRTENGEQFLTAMEAYNHNIYALMYHPEYQMLEFVSEKTWNTIQNQDTQDIIEHIGEFIYEQASHLRKLNLKKSESKDLYTDSITYFQNVAIEDINKLWGISEPYLIGGGIVIEAYAIPLETKARRVKARNLPHHHN